MPLWANPRTVRHRGHGGVDRRHQDRALRGRLAGMIERRDRTVLRMGHDSLGVLGVYLGGVGILYALR